MIVAVVAALVWTIRKAFVDFQQQPIQLSEIDFSKLALAAVVYIGAMLMSWIFWYQVLISLKQKPRLLKSLGAFLISQLGKYVPGKAMVIVIRTDRVRDDKVSIAPAAASVFVETFAWIFVGSAIASGLLIVKFQDFRWLQILAVLLMIGAGVVTWPPIFNWLATKIRPINSKRHNYAVDLRTMLTGWVALAFGWLLNGTCLWLVVSALPGANPTTADILVTLAAVTLATVGGFVSLIPGGLGVRELVMIPLLGSQFGTVIAVMAAILVRLVWLSAELVSSAILYVTEHWIEKRRSKNGKS